MKIAIGSMKHESNSFNPEPTELDEFTFKCGDEILDDLSHLENTSLSGMVEILEERNVEVVPTCIAYAHCPGGLPSVSTYKRIKEGFLRNLSDVKDIDGICLDLHGSMTVPKIGDAEGDLLRSLASTTSSNVPIAASLDMHAMVTEQMIKNANAFVGYRTAPHVDKIKTGRKVAKVLYESIRGEYSLKMGAVKLPMLVSGEKSETDAKPMCSLIKELRKIDKISDVLSSSYFLGFPWVDRNYNHGSAVVVSKGDEKIARENAVHLANKFWESHEKFDFTTKAFQFKDALENANKSEKSPIFVCDSGDNPGAGGSEDITFCLKKMLEQRVNDTLFASIADHSAYTACAKEGIGSEIRLPLGRKSSDPNSEPSHFAGIVKSLHQLKNMSVALLEVDGIDVVVTTKRTMMTNPEFLFKLNIDPREYEIVVLKSGYLVPSYESIAADVMLAITPGYTDQNLTNLDYSEVQRPIYPLDEELKFKAEDNLIIS